MKHPPPGPPSARYNAGQLAFLPIILSYPEGRKWGRRQLPQPTFHDQAPMIVLVLSAVTGILFGGIGAIAFPVPALLWCAISYRVRVTKDISRAGSPNHIDTHFVIPDAFLLSPLP